MNFSRENAAFFKDSDYEFSVNDYDMGQIRTRIEKAVDGKYIATPTSANTCCGSVDKTDMDDDTYGTCIYPVETVYDDRYSDEFRKFYYYRYTDTYPNYSMLYDGTIYLFTAKSSSYKMKGRYSIFLRDLSIDCSDENCTYRTNEGMIFTGENYAFAPRDGDYLCIFDKNVKDPEYCECKTTSSIPRWAVGYRMRKYYDKIYGIAPLPETTKVFSIDTSGNFEIISEIDTRDMDTNHRPLVDTFAISHDGIAYWHYARMIGDDVSEDEELCMVEISLGTGYYEKYFRKKFPDVNYSNASQWSDGNVKENALYRAWYIGCYGDYVIMQAGNIGYSSHGGILLMHRKTKMIVQCSGDKCAISSHVEYKTEEMYPDYYYVDDNGVVKKIEWKKTDCSKQ